MITPPFEGRDEPDHFAYVQQLQERWALPGPGRDEYSPAEEQILVALHQPEIRFSPQTPALTTTAEQRNLQEVIDERFSNIGSGQAGVAASEPPLYYALETLPYAVASSNVLVALELMRLLSALLGAMSMILVVLFLREALPGVPWATTAGGLCVAMFPLFGFMSGTLNPDNLLYTVTAAIFLCLARAFRRGFTARRAVAIGCLLAIGLLTKVNFVGLVPGILIGVLVLSVRSSRSGGGGGLKPLAIVALIGGAPVAVYAIGNLITGAPVLGIASGLFPSVSGSLFRTLDYTWQLYLPKLPGMPGYFHGLMTFRELWFDRMVGLYGWVDTMFPSWVNDVALIPAAAIAALCLREMVHRRKTLRARLPELAVYTLMGLGVLMIVGAISYLSDAVDGLEAYADPRYLLPMLALLAAALTLAVRGAGRRWGPVVAIAMVALFFAHDLFSQLQVISRYYG